jgi:glycosyltransferase involved in cell wall biosynthesis
VGFRVIQALRRLHDVEVATSAMMRAPDGVPARTVRLRFQEPNDVGPSQLFCFEILQRSMVERLLKRGTFDLVHRVTPSGYKDSLLRVPPVPLVLGPVLGADPPPPSFDPIFRPRLSRSISPSAVTARIANGLARRIFERFSTLNRLLEKAALILVGTEVTRRRLPERLHSRCRLLTYAGVELDQFIPPLKGRGGMPPQLLFAGRIVPYKGVELLLRSAALARRRCRFELKIVGTGYPPYERYCRQLAAELRLTDVVSFVERVRREALIDVYQAADIFCMPSIETYGVAILEAMSSGCAVLVADANGPGEIVQPGTGLKVPLNTPEQFVEEYAERIVELVEDANLRHVLGKRAREHVVKHHDWEKIGTSLLEIYDEFFSEGAGASRTATCRSASGSV